MKTTPVFKGVATALVTPFDREGIAWASFGKYIENQLTGGIDALVVCGTTGESATLSEREHTACVSFAVRQVRKRVPVIAGCGANDQAKACRLAAAARAAGADALLAVTPYYNKCTAEGLRGYYEAIAEAGGLPLIVYNVPSRTGVNITPAQYESLSAIPGVCGIKEAGNDIAAFARTAAVCRDRIALYTGNDELFLPCLSLGGSGVISVASNLVPMRMKKIWHAFFSGAVTHAAFLQSELTELETLLFSAPNPIPVKYALARMGLMENILRPPLTSLSSDASAALEQTLRQLRVPLTALCAPAVVSA